MTAVSARRAEIDRRYKSKRADKPPISMTALRIADLRRLFLSRYGRTLPDDDAGRDDAMTMAHHIVRRQGDPRRNIRSWIELQCPWMTQEETAATIDRVTSNPIRWRADKLAQRLHLTEAERRRLGITTIGAIDMTKAERLQARKLRQRQRMRGRRKARGAKPRAEYEAKSANRIKPWIAAGISRATSLTVELRKEELARREREKIAAVAVVEKHFKAQVAEVADLEKAAIHFSDCFNRYREAVRQTNNCPWPADLLPSATDKYSPYRRNDGEVVSAHIGGALRITQGAADNLIANLGMRTAGLAERAAASAESFIASLRDAPLPKLYDEQADEAAA